MELGVGRVQRFGDERSTPKCTVLVLDIDWFSVFVNSRATPRLVKEQPRQDPSLLSQINANTPIAAGCRVAFVVHQIDVLQHCIEPAGEFCPGRDLVSDAIVTDVGLGTTQSAFLSDGRQHVKTRRS